MTIREGGADLKNPSVNARMDGSTQTMTIYTPNLESNAKSSQNDPTKYGASVIGHEAAPGHMAPMTSRADRLQVEIGGYTVQEATSRALGVYDSTQTTAYGPDRQTRILNNATNSVNNACQGSAHPTCR